MKITKESHKLMSFFIENNCLIPLKQTKPQTALFKQLFNDISNGFRYIEDIKTKMGSSFYKLRITNITNISQIPKPTTFPSNSFPLEIRNHIDEYSLSLFTYSFNLFKRKIQIIFLTEDERPEKLIEIYNNYVKHMLVWLYIVDQYSSKNCSNELTIYIYHTPLLKLLPSSNIDILGETNVNTAFTSSCSKKSEIVIFRKEEWFKAFIHETIHNFGLDFSDMNTSVKKILSIFPVKSDVKLYESYAEFWARFTNALFCSYTNMKNKNDFNEFLTNAEFFINFERIFAFFQMVKILNFMGLTYSQLYQRDIYSDNIRNLMYKEDTSVLSYYILTLILFNNYNEFLSWCNTNNTSLLQFKKTLPNMDSFYKFIEKKYKSKNMLDGVECTEVLVSRFNKLGKKQKDVGYLLKTLRMTICELG